MGWLASKASIASIIAGAKTPEQVKANASAVEWRLSVADMAAVNELLAGARASH
jgi:aryl-alcohol dehydrogenase-like predicted oxidoreductase